MGNDTFLHAAPLCIDSAFNPGFAQQFCACFWDELKATKEIAERAAAKAEAAAEEKKEETTSTTTATSSSSMKKKKAAMKKVDNSTTSAAEVEEEKEQKIPKAASEEQTLHLLEPFLQVLADPQFSDSFARLVVKELLSEKLPNELREVVADELFDVAMDDEIKQYKREQLLSLVKQLKDDEIPAEEVRLVERELKLNPKLEAPRKGLRKGLGVRTRNQHKVRQRDKR